MTDRHNEPFAPLNFHRQSGRSFHLPCAQTQTWRLVGSSDPLCVCLIGALFSRRPDVAGDVVDPGNLEVMKPGVLFGHCLARAPESHSWRRNFLTRVGIDCILGMLVSVAN